MFTKDKMDRWIFAHSLEPGELIWFEEEVELLDMPWQGSDEPRIDYQKFLLPYKTVVYMGEVNHGAGYFEYKIFHEGMIWYINDVDFQHHVNRCPKPDFEEAAKSS